LFVEKSRLIDRAFGTHDSQTPVPVDLKARTNVTTFEAKFAQADVTIKVEDYSLFATMAEFVKEVIPSLYFRQTGKKAIVRVVLSPVMSELATGDPLYVIDGIATKNTDYFVSLKPSDLISVKVVFAPTKLLPLGLLGKNGIVIVQTKKGNVNAIPENTILPMEGVAVPMRFPTVDPLNITNQDKPYFRSTIYWNPSISTDETGKASVEFFCSDDVGKLTIRLDGLSTSGNAFSAEHQIEVSNEPEKK
jgi:hypothetical protein